MGSARPTVTYNRGLDSVIGAHGPNREYVVYNWVQVDIEGVYIGKEKIFPIYYRIEQVLKYLLGS